MSTNPISDQAVGRRFIAPALKRLATACMASVVLVLAACSTTGEGGEVKVDEVAVMLSRAKDLDKSEKGQAESRSIYQEAAAKFPADKRPWVRLAQNYFDAADYGNAILAAQEAVQRDPKDEVAQGILAISGLRISTASLTVLRNQSALDGSTKTNAQDMTKNLRSVLGVPVLVPRSEVEAKPPVRKRTKPVSTRRKTAPAPKAATPAAPVKKAAPPPATKPGNPFGAFN